jgi:hypothetical protein
MEPKQLQDLSTLQRPELHLYVPTPKGPKLHLDLSGQQKPVLDLDMSTTLALPNYR